MPDDPMTETPPSEDEPGIPIMDVPDLAEAGLLWYINATAFHPHGVALVLTEDHDGTPHFGLTPANLGEPYSFPDDEHIHQRYRQAMATLAEARIFGFSEQVPVVMQPPEERSPLPPVEFITLNNDVAYLRSLRNDADWWAIDCAGNPHFHKTGPRRRVIAQWQDHVLRSHS